MTGMALHNYDFFLLSLSLSLSPLPLLDAETPSASPHVTRCGYIFLALAGMRDGWCVWPSWGKGWGVQFFFSLSLSLFFRGGERWGMQRVSHWEDRVGFCIRLSLFLRWMRDMTGWRDRGERGCWPLWRRGGLLIRGLVSRVDYGRLKE